MEGIVCLFCQQLMGACAHIYIRGFDADHHLMIVKVLDHAHFIQCALHQPFGCHALVFLDQFFFQGAAVDAHPYGDGPLPGCLHHRADSLRPADVPGVDPDLVRAVFHCRDSHAVVKMDVRHQRDMDLFFNLF